MVTKRKITDYLPDKKKEKASVRLELDEELYQKGKRYLKKRGNTVTDLIEAAFQQLIDEVEKN